MSGKELKKHLSRLLETFQSLPSDHLHIEQYAYALTTNFVTVTKGIRTKTALVRLYSMNSGYVQDERLITKYYDNSIKVFIDGIYDTEH